MRLDERITGPSGFVDAITTRWFGTRVCNAHSFEPGMRIEVWSRKLEKKLGAVTVKRVVRDRFGHETGEIVFNEPLPHGTRRGSLLVHIDSE